MPPTHPPTPHATPTSTLTPHLPSLCRPPQVASMLDRLSGKPCEAIADALADAAVKAGTTDDVSVVVLRLK